MSKTGSRTFARWALISEFLWVTSDSTRIRRKVNGDGIYILPLSSVFPPLRLFPPPNTRRNILFPFLEILDSRRLEWIMPWTSVTLDLRLPRKFLKIRNIFWQANQCQKKVSNELYNLCDQQRFIWYIINLMRQHATCHWHLLTGCLLV